MTRCNFSHRNQCLSFFLQSSVTLVSSEKRNGIFSPELTAILRQLHAFLCRALHCSVLLPLFMFTNLISLEKISMMNTLCKNISPDISLANKTLPYNLYCYAHQTEFLTSTVLSLTYLFLLMMFLHIRILSFNSCTMKSPSFKVQFKCQTLDEDFFDVLKS